MSLTPDQIAQLMLANAQANWLGNPSNTVSNIPVAQAIAAIGDAQFISGIPVIGTPSDGFTLEYSNDAKALIWVPMGGGSGGSPTGPAGGDLANFYPNPTVHNFSIGGDVQGDVYYRGSTNLARLPAGAPGQVLQTNGAHADPTWATLPAPPSSLPPTGPAGGDLANTYPNPIVQNITLGSDSQGDVYYRGATTLTRLPAGTSGFFLQTEGSSANPTWSNTATAGLNISTGQAVSGVAELSLNAATGNPINFDINNALKARITSTGGFVLGHAIDPGAGNLSITGAYELETGGVNFIIARVRSSDGTMQIGDVSAYSGATSLAFYFAGSSVFAATTTLVNSLPQNFYVNSCLSILYDGTNLSFGSGNTTGFTVLNAATGFPINFQINNTTKAQLSATGGFSIGHTFDPGAGNLSITGNYELETGGVNYSVIRSVGGVIEVGDIGAIPGLTALEFLFAGSPIFAASPTLTSLVPPSLYINGVLFAQSSGGNFIIGGGLGAGQSLALSGVGSTTSGIFFQFHTTTLCGFRYSGATYDSSGAVLDLSANGVQGSGIIFANPASAKQSTFNILSATTVYPCDTQGGTVTVIANLPALSSVPKGLTFYIYDALGTATSSHPIQLSPLGTDSIRGINASFTIKIGSTYAFVGAIVTASATGWDVMLTQ